MKKLYLILLIVLLLCAEAFPADIGFCRKHGGGAAASCTTPTGDELTESFGDSTTSCWSGGDSLCNNTWTVQAGTPTIANVTGTPAENTACAKVFHFDAAVNTYKDLGVGFDGTGAVNIKFHVYIDSSQLNQYANSPFFALNATTANISDGTNRYVSCHLYRAQAGVAQPADKLYCNASTNSLTFAEDTHYDCTVSLDALVDGVANVNGSSISCNGGASAAFTRGAVASRYVHVGISAANIVGDIGYVTVTTP
jgi:hypothetical protein